MEELQKQIIIWQKELNNLEGHPDTKALEDYEEHLKSIVNSAASIGSSISNMAFSLAKNGLKDLSVVLVLGLDINFVSNNSIIKNNLRKNILEVKTIVIIYLIPKNNVNNVL